MDDKHKMYPYFLIGIVAQARLNYILSHWSIITQSMAMMMAHDDEDDDNDGYGDDDDDDDDKRTCLSQTRICDASHIRI